ncbi:hypothetical protein ACVIF9_006707 [Bradyrhizobium sp. USDA 4350]
MATQNDIRRVSVRTREQSNPQCFAVQELALSVSAGPEQLTFPDLVVMERARELLTVYGDMKAHRATRLFDFGAVVSYRGVQTRTAPTVRFCWTVERNAAGRFLIFRERQTRTRIQRDQVEAIGDKRAAIHACRLYRDAVDAKRDRKQARKNGGGR